MVIVKNPKSVAYFFHEKEGNVSHGVTFSEVPLRGVKYVKMVSEKLPDGYYTTKLYYNGKSITITDNDKNDCGYVYSMSIQKAIHKLLGVNFPEKKYENTFKRMMKNNKGGCSK